MLQYYAQRWQFYLTSNTVVQFLPGEHVLEGDWNELFVENVTNLTLIGSDTAITDSLPLSLPTAHSNLLQEHALLARTGLLCWKSGRTATSERSAEGCGKVGVDMMLQWWA